MTHDDDHNTHNLTDADAAALSRQLDALGRAEAAEACPGLESAVFAASRAHLMATPTDVFAIAAEVDKLAQHEQANASPRLEQQAFELSREAVASGRFAAPVESEPSLHIHEARARRSSRGHLLGLSLRIAAALALLVGAGVMVNRFTPASPQLAANNSRHTSETNTAELASRISTEMDALFEAMTLDAARDDVSLDTSRDADWDANWVDELFSQESL